MFTFVAIDNDKQPMPIKLSQNGQVPSKTKAQPQTKTQMTKANMPDAKNLTLRIQTTTNDKNYNGDIFGGWLLARMDEACSLTARRYSKKNVATVGLEAMSFHKPVHVDEVVSFYTNIERVGNTSLRIKVEAWSQPVQGKAAKKVTEGSFTYVALDKNRQPVKVIEG